MILVTGGLDVPVATTFSTTARGADILVADSFALDRLRDGGDLGPRPDQRLAQLAADEPAGACDQDFLPSILHDLRAN